MIIRCGAWDTSRDDNALLPHVLPFYCILRARVRHRAVRPHFILYVPSRDLDPALLIAVCLTRARVRVRFIVVEGGSTVVNGGITVVDGGCIVGLLDPRMAYRILSYARTRARKIHSG